MKVFSRCTFCLAVLVMMGMASSGLAITQLNITSISTALYPQVTLQVTTDAPGLEAAAFTATEDLIPVQLLDDCFITDSLFVDIVFVVDISNSMEPKIEAVANGIHQLVDSIVTYRPATSFRFALITYGGSGCPATPVICPIPGYPDADAQYYGAPRNYNTGGLWGADQLTATLLDIASQNLTGGQEPAYHAIVGAVANTEWRTNSSRIVVLVSDENNDYAEDPNLTPGSLCSSCGDRIIPYVSMQGVVDYLQEQSVTLFTWCNPDTACDLYDRADDVPGGDNLPCQPLSDFGCRPGLSDFGPIADSLGGCVVLMIEPVQPEQVEELFGCIQLSILSTYQLCYIATCCIPAHVYNVVVTAEDVDFSTASDNATYSMASCPAGQAPEVSCWTGNPTTYTYGQPVTMCATVTDGDNNLTHVWASYTTPGGCDEDSVAATDMGGGRWCITVPGTCTDFCGTLGVTFYARDACLAQDSETCTALLFNTPPSLTCTNPGLTVPYGQPAQICVTASDAQNNLQQVNYSYNNGAGCISSGAATNIGGNQWCVTVPGNCTRVCAGVDVSFTAVDVCGATSSPIICSVTITNTPPTADCWTGNPPSFQYGQPLQVCATVSDPEGNVLRVRAQYNLGAGCIFDGDATNMGGGRYCVTVPGTCTDICTPIQVTFTPYDSCEDLAAGTPVVCTIPLANLPPTVTCANPSQTVNYGQAVTVCATASDDANCINGVTASYNIAPGCTFSGPATFTGGQWCVTIPANCTRVCGAGGGNGTIAVTFVATDCCNLTSTPTVCNVSVVNQPPTAACYTGNPAFFVYGQPLTVCATASDPNGNLQRVRAQYNLGDGCIFDGDATQGPAGRFCVTIPGTCTDICSAISVTFTAYDSCGLAGTPVVCTVASNNQPPVAVCYTGNPAQVFYGEAATICVTVTDAENCINGVTASWNSGLATCSYNGPATLAAPGRYCITIPAQCTRICGAGGNPATISVTFIATDCCGQNSTPVTCNLQVVNRPPTNVCFTGNPANYTFGQPLTLCATAADPDGNLQGVQASYNVGPGCVFSGPAVFDGVKWCVTVPGTCTDTCGTISVTFRAVDSCGVQSASAVTCSATLTNLPPTAACWTGNPATYLWGQGFSVCATASDPEGCIQRVVATYNLGAGCTFTGDAFFTSGRYCTNISNACAMRCTPIQVTFTPYDCCGLAGTPVTCTVNNQPRPPVVTLWPANPTEYLWGETVTVYATVSDPDNNVVQVTANYTTCECTNVTVTPLFIEPDRWCLTIPQNCTGCCTPISFTFTARDSCNQTDSESGSVTLHQYDPVIICAADFPSVLYEGDAATLCAEVTDFDNNVTGVTATYNIAHPPVPGCDGTAVAYDAGGGRWCIDLPAGCTNGLGGQSILVTYIVRDACLGDDTVQCAAPVIPNLCWDLGDLEEYGTEMQCLGGPAHAYRIADGSRARIAWLGSTSDCDGDIGEDFDEDQDDGLLHADESPESFCEYYSGFRGCIEEELEVHVSTGPGYTGQTLYLSVWYDGNGNNDFDDEWDCPDNNTFSEWLVQDAIVTPGTNFLPVIVDNTTPDGRVVLRMRLGVNQTFGRYGYEDPLVGPPQCTPFVDGEVEDYILACPSPDCCALCYLDPPVVQTNDFVENSDADLHVVAQLRNGRIRLNWQPVPGAQYYQVFRGNGGIAFEDMTAMGMVDANVTSWTDMSATISQLPYLQEYQVAAFVVAPRQLQTTDEGDLGLWWMDQIEDNCVPDQSGNDRPACRVECSSPEEILVQYDEECEYDVDYMYFRGCWREDGVMCNDHLRVANDDVWYEDYFQVWTRIRIYEQPTIQTGPFYIVSNNSFDINGGGFALRIDPGWYTVGGVRHYHNRLTGMVWNQDLDGGEGGWMTLQSPAPSASDPDRWSVPLNEWVCVCMIVNGNRSMLIINDRVVAAGELRFNSHNNNAPLIIGAGYRHNTYPIEYPFKGDIDCVRITSLD